MIVFFQKRDKFCENVTTPSSQPLKEIVEETMSYPFKKAFEDGKTVWNLSPGMMSGHLEGKGGLSVKCFRCQLSLWIFLTVWRLTSGWFMTSLHRGNHRWRLHTFHETFAKKIFYIKCRTTLVGCLPAVLYLHSNGDSDVQTRL